MMSPEFVGWVEPLARLRASAMRYGHDVAVPAVSLLPRVPHHPSRAEMWNGYLHSASQTRVSALMAPPILRHTSRRDHDLADDLAVLDEAQALARLFERQHLVDHRLHLAVRDELHQRLQVFVVKAVGADDLQFEAPDIAQVLFRVVAGGRAAAQE